MADLNHICGQALQISASGGIKLTSGHEEIQQRVIRRLLTSGGDLLMDVKYGAGLPKMIGSPENEDIVLAIIRQQLKLESTVQQNPAPKIGMYVDPGSGTFTATIRYVDNNTLEVNQVKIPISTVVGK